MNNRAERLLPQDPAVPELPEIELYLHALEPLVVGRVLERIRIRTPSLLRTYDPRVSEVEGTSVVGLRRIGKRVAFALEGDLFAVVHLMISGRFQWKDSPGAPLPKRRAHAAFDFEHGTLVLTEASTHKRAALFIVRGEKGLEALDPGGVEPLQVGLEGFRAALVRENRTLKRALTDPRILAGIGNAHSDEILLRAGLSPVRRTRQLDSAEVETLYREMRAELGEWVQRLRDEAGDTFPRKITAFHPEMGAHGKFGEPCPRCGSPIQRIVHGERESNYCATCQTGGRLLKDRALSRLLREDWPRTLEELEGMHQR